MNRHAIEVTPIGGHDYGVLVDGVHWCFAKREPQGMHGARYTFHYHAQGAAITERAGRGEAPSDVVVWSDKRWLSSQGFYGSGGMAKRQAVHEGKYKTIQERIAETAARLIKKKLIVSPEELTARHEARAAISLRQREEFEAVSRKRLEVEARKAVREMQLPDCGASANDRFITRIVEAMEWARSNT